MQSQMLSMLGENFLVAQGGSMQAYTEIRQINTCFSLELFFDLKFLNKN